MFIAIMPVETSLGVVLTALEEFSFPGEAAENLIRREPQRTNAQREGLAKSGNATDQWVSPQGSSVRWPGEIVFLDDNRAIRLAHGDGIGLRRAHHDALKNGLSTHEYFFACFQQKNSEIGDPQLQVPNPRTRHKFLCLREFTIGSFPGLREESLIRGRRFIFAVFAVEALNASRSIDEFLLASKEKDGIWSRSPNESRFPWWNES